MHPAIAKLLSLASESISSVLAPDETDGFLASWGDVGKELAELLRCRNGFYAFDSALLIRPWKHQVAPFGLLKWNAPELWIGQYREDISNALFFGEDLFGGQFCLRGDRVCSFDPETGLFEDMSGTLANWADDLLADCDFRTGYPLARAWQVERQRLPSGVRLLPKTPFVCGGKYEIENLHPVADVDGMRFRGSVANQIRDLPDGSEIVFEVSPPVP